jgi:hypothetical protein
MNIVWGIVIVAHLGAKPVFVEAWQTKEPCELYAKQIQNAICVPVVVGNKHSIEKQVQSLNELLR